MASILMASSTESTHLVGINEASSQAAKAQKVKAKYDLKDSVEMEYRQNYRTCSAYRPHHWPSLEYVSHRRRWMKKQAKLFQKKASGTVVVNSAFDTDSAPVLSESEGTLIVLSVLKFPVK